MNNQLKTGLSSESPGKHTLVIGMGNVVKGEYSVVLGSRNKVKGNHCVVIGSGIELEGDHKIAIGHTDKLDDQTIAMLQDLTKDSVHVLDAIIRALLKVREEARRQHD
jgi:hypothetical protein